MKMSITCNHCQQAFMGDEGRKYCSHPCYLIAQKRPLLDRFWEKVQKTETCWLWTGTKVPGGYGILSEGTRPIQHSAHRMSYKIHVGPIPDGLFVLHHCDNPPCVNPAHLFLGTAKDNSQDMARKGRSGKGEKNAMAKLTEADVRDIRRQYAAGGVTQRAIATQRGLSQSVIANIVNGHLWSHVT